MSVPNKEVVKGILLSWGGNEMAHFTKGTAKLIPVGRRQWLFETEPFSAVTNKTFDSALNDCRLKKHLKRAVNRPFAPQSLIDSIRSGIRG